MTARTVRYVRIAVTKEMIQRAAIDVAEHAERNARRALSNDPDVRVRWDAELFDRDERGDPILIEWTPGTPVPAHTCVLLCTAVVRPADQSSEREMPQGLRLEVTG